jgi:hypothetical protein
MPEVKRWVDSPWIVPFLEWKRNTDPPWKLKRNEDGKFYDFVVRGQWSAYRQALRDSGKALADPSLPPDPPEHVIAAMVAAGARPGWAKDIYNAAVSALKEKPE